MTIDYNKTLELLYDSCNLLTKKNRLRFIKTSHKTTICYVITNPEEKWVKLEDYAKTIMEKIEKVIKDFNRLILLIDDLKNFTD
jgi:ferritin